MRDRDVSEFYVVHDDEVVEEGHEGGDLSRGGLDEEGVGLSEDGGVALDAALRAEDEVVAAFAGFQILD